MSAATAAMPGDRRQQIFVAVINVAAHQGGQRDFLTQPGQPA
jgi:hypothetical protein